MAALNESRKYHCTPFVDATMMTQIHFFAVITKVADSFKSHIDLQNTCTMDIVKGHEIEVERLLRLYQSWPCQKGCEVAQQSLEWFRKLLPISAANILNGFPICIERVVRDYAEEPHSHFSFRDERRTSKHRKSKIYNYPSGSSKRTLLPRPHQSCVS